VTDDELEALLEELEEALLKDVQGALDDTAQDFLYAVDRATELVAARFSVSGIRNMWRRRVGTIMNRLRSISGRAATAAAEDVGDRLPRGWDENLAQYTTATRALLNAVGDRLAAEASQSLAEGLNAGEDLDELKTRMTTLFAADGTQLGPGRAERIAMTEATRAFNAGTLAAAQALTGPDRPLVKQWVTRRDARVREAHADTNGQLQLLDEPFDVSGTPMQYPGDPTAPASLTVNCRCVMRTAVAEGNREVDQDDMSAADGQDFQSKMPAQLKRYWLTGEGAAKIGWGTPGSFDRCVSSLRDDFPQDPEGLCANLYHEATGKWPGQNKSGADVHTGAMLALMPTVEDAQRLALEGGEPADQLHLTLFYLGDAVDWSEQQRGDLISRVAAAARYLKPVAGRVFGGAQWNPTSDEPAWVWNVGDDLDQDSSRLQDAKYEITYALEDGHNDPELPQQYSPWAPHICAVYGPDDWGSVLADRVGPVTFDRVRVAFAGQYTDIPLTGAALGTLADVDYIEPADEVEYEQPPQLLTWSTPGATALAFENQQTGDGRVFAPGALYWAGGPWPLQYADEMNGGHDGARLAGAIFDMSRDGDRVAGAGVLYLTQQAGVESAMLLSQGAPLGVSVDLDDVDLEVSVPDAEGAQIDAQPVYAARLVTASLLPLPDGGWHLKGETATEYTASGASTVGESSRVDIVVDRDGRIPSDAFQISAAAGDADVQGEVIQRQMSGEVLMRITRARIRGATLVSIPAYADARIVLDDMSMFAAADTVTASAAGNPYEVVVRCVRKSLTPMTAADVAKLTGVRIGDVRRYLARAAKKGQVTRLVHGRYVGPSTASVNLFRGNLSSCGQDGTTTASAEADSASSGTSRTQSGASVGADGGSTRAESGSSSVTRGGSTSPVTARSNVPDVFPGTSAGNVARPSNPARQSDAATAAAVPLPTGTSWSGAGTTSSAPTGSAQPTLNDSSQTRADAAPSAGTESRSSTRTATGTPRTLTTVTAPDATARSCASPVTADSGTSGTTHSGSNAQPPTFANMDGDMRITPKQPDELDEMAASGAPDEQMEGHEDMEASAWSAMRNLPAMPAAWFAAPTAEELPPGGPGVNYRDGRIFGWVAQAGEPHAGYAQRVTIDTLGRIDTTHFLRQRFTLDDGSTVKAGAFTMNVGHHRDGAECETSACQFDDTRTVAGIVTVGMSDRGMWFSGAAAPWMSDWDRSVFMATQPSYHMKKGPSGNWQLRAVLAVPVPGHSSPLLASAVVDRANMALTAAATMAEVEEAVAAAEAAQAADELIQHDQDSGHYPEQAPVVQLGGFDYDRLADALVAAMGRAEQQKLDEQAELEALLAEGRKLDGDTGTEGD
jgi:2'-5' RNA ligase